VSDFCNVSLGLPFLYCYRTLFCTTISVTLSERSKGWVCGRSFSEIVSSIPAGCMDVCLLWVLFVVRGVCFGLITRLEGVLPSVMSDSVWSWSPLREGHDPESGGRATGKIIIIHITWPFEVEHCLRRGYAAFRLRGLWFRIPPVAWVSLASVVFC